MVIVTKNKETVRLLQRLGFGDYEARAYLALLRGGWYVRNGIALAALVSDPGERLPAMLSTQAAGVLSTPGSRGLAGGWLEQIRAALHRPRLSSSRTEVTVALRETVEK
jgi:hypothetical protein